MNRDEIKDLAIKILGMKAASDFSCEVGTDDWVEFDLELASAATELAYNIVLSSPLDGHTRIGDIVDYANANGFCLEHAVVELVNAGLSVVKPASASK